jgi:hypothetical protein
VGINFIANHVIRLIFLITHIVIGIAQNTKQAQQKNGLKQDKRNAYLWIIIICFYLPKKIAEIANYNKSIMYGLLRKTAA